MNSRFSYLLKNTGLLLIGNFSSKILVFFLVPLYTSVLSTEEYGIFDLLDTTMLLIYPILTLNIIDGVMRFSLDNNYKKNEVFTIGIKYIFISIALIFIVLINLNLIFKYDYLKSYSMNFVLLYISYSFYQLLIQFTRGLDEIKKISIAGVISTIVMIFSNVMFLLFMNLKLNGYFYAYILSYFIPSIYLFIKCKLWQYFAIGSMRLSVSKNEVDMLKYSIPMIFTTIGWYINSVSDRYVVTLFCGFSANGLYSVAYKIPSILVSLQTIFIQAWQLSAIKEISSEDKTKFYNQMYEICQFVMVFSCSLLIILTKLLAKLLFSNDFFEAWYYVPFLLLYCVFNTLSGVLGGIFAAVKDTRIFAKTAIIGAILNIVLNVLLVYKFGAIGAVVATVVSSIVIWFQRIQCSNQYIHWEFNKTRHYFEYILLLIQALIIMKVSASSAYIMEFIVLIILLVINKEKINQLKKYLIGRWLKK